MWAGLLTSSLYIDNHKANAVDDLLNSLSYQPKIWFVELSAILPIAPVTVVTNSGARKMTPTTNRILMMLSLHFSMPFSVPSRAFTTLKPMPTRARGAVIACSISQMPFRMVLPADVICWKPCAVSVFAAKAVTVNIAAVRHTTVAKETMRARTRCLS